MSAAPALEAPCPALIERLRTLALHRVMWGADKDHLKLVASGYATVKPQQFDRRGWQNVYRITGKGEAALTSLEKYL